MISPRMRSNPIEKSDYNDFHRSIERLFVNLANYKELRIGSNSHIGLS